jgi:glucose/mannose-6-phosphate isomerase
VVAPTSREAFDGGGMAAAIDGLADQLRQGERIGAEAGRRLRPPSAVVIAGMGGSAMGGELLRALVAADCPVPMTRVRGFGVPAWAGPGTLVVAVSYSGRTAETLACAEQAHRQGAGLLCVGAGGELGELADACGAPFARVPGGMQPRAALGYLFGALVSALAAAGLAPPGTALRCAAGVDTVDPAAARRLGVRLAGTVPLVYGAGARAAVAYRWKTQFNENAKMPAFSHAFPEVVHNEIVGWEGGPEGVFSAVLLRDPDHPGNRRAMDIAQEMLAGEAAVLAALEGRGPDAAARAFHLIAVGDWASYGAALARGVDPTPIVRIDAFKRTGPEMRPDG